MIDTCVRRFMRISAMCHRNRSFSIDCETRSRRRPQYRGAIDHTQYIHEIQLYTPTISRARRGLYARFSRKGTPTMQRLLGVCGGNINRMMSAEAVKIMYTSKQETDEHLRQPLQVARTALFSNVSASLRKS